MKRTIEYIAAALLLLSVSTSCKKYLEANPQSDYVYISSVSDCQALLDDNFTMNFYTPTSQIIASDEYYVTDASLNNSSQVSSADQRINYTWYTENTAPKSNTDWSQSYNKISVANLVLENIDKLRKDNNTPELANAEGGALFQRAYNLWFVAQLYAKPYNKGTASQDPGVPVRLTFDLNEKISRGTVQQTYDQVIADLKKAALLLPDNATVATRGSKVAAYALLARVYLSMGEYAAALENASLALAINSSLLDFSQLSTTSNTPIPVFNKEVIFHTMYYLTGILNQGTGTNGVAKIAPELVGSYSAQDLRKQVYFKQNTGADAGTYRFTGSYGELAGYVFFEGIAVDEMYLTRAECYARLGNVTASMADLNTLLKTRFVNTSSNPYVPVTATDATQALSIILAERKKELVMRGLRWTDLRRLNLDPATAVTWQRVANGITYTLPPNDLRYTMLIPMDVISMGNVAQNPR